MIGWIAETLGGAIKDTVNVLEEVVEDVSSIGDRFEKGYEDGLITSNEEVTDKEATSTKEEETDDQENSETKE